MKDYIADKRYHIELVPPKQSSEELEKELGKLERRYNRVVDKGYIACICDNAMGNISFQGTELIDELGLEVKPGLVSIHLNTFHTKQELDEILKAGVDNNIEDILVVTGDGNERLPKLTPEDIGVEGVESVTSVELLKYIRREYNDTFTLGVAFNPYEPADHEIEKMKRKVDASAEYAITQPVIEQHELVDKLLEDFDIPVIVESWMSRKLHLLSDAVGYEIPEDTLYDPIENLKTLHERYEGCGFYLAFVGFKTQFPVLPEIWP